MIQHDAAIRFPRPDAWSKTPRTKGTMKDVLWHMWHAHTSCCFPIWCTFIMDLSCLFVFIFPIWCTSSLLLTLWSTHLSLAGMVFDTLLGLYSITERNHDMWPANFELCRFLAACFSRTWLLKGFLGVGSASEKAARYTRLRNVR